MHELTGKTAFVTGGAQGIGLGIAHECAAKGMKVAIVDVDEQALREAEQELSRKTDVVAMVLDVRDREAYAEVADRVEAQLGNVTLLCNNAGVAGNTTVTNLSYAAWDWVVGINLTGVYNGIQTFVPRMIERNEPAHILNTASGAGLLGAGAGFLYSASKFGVVGLSEALRTELEPHNIGVSVLCPSAVATGIISNTTASAPKVDQGPTVMAGLDDRLQVFAKMLAHGATPDQVGRMAIDAVRENRLYVLTDSLLKEWLEKRTAEIIDAMP
ncbi:SDR family NAD(P)-dependent oxidoreductase [Nocardia sp. NBC_00508]|uniref:SDR family oxidoreductase n=1 Tax=Nocardia sp. NBC_00508 TaxID=2975992 RepID=UPI002E805A73|nr:SDR family NAD(P)-dependent oxidoreductase [Nocardia sp. NBC_00508]WUD67083.1 SDR family NAD(P)-dependent oxidoreductase [Nocardia sp. NBC_00508]